jgi:hypothetical protein
MAIFNSCVSLPEGMFHAIYFPKATHKVFPRKTTEAALVQTMLDAVEAGRSNQKLHHRS